MLLLVAWDGRTPTEASVRAAVVDQSCTASADGGVSCSPATL